MNLISALRKQKPDKSRYRRPAKIEASLQTLESLSRDELVARAQIRARDDAHYIPTECLVYFVRASRADNSDAWFERLYKVLSARVLRALPFPGHSPEFLDLVTPGLAAAFAEIHEGHTIADRVKSVLKRSLASGRPEVAHVARDLGMSERTLQRRITGEATTFRVLLSDARRELSQQLLADPAIHIDEVTYLLGYQDTTSFYRAFKDWAGVSPGEWRSGIETESQTSGAMH